jgi:lipoate-protein ligase A
MARRVRGIGFRASLCFLGAWIFGEGLHAPRVLPQLQLWLDPVPRDGPENMAVDQWLAETCEVPVLRSYRWTPGWGSFGYFVKTADLPAKGLKWVRRWTGGGIVDHREDWTYTLFIPVGFGLAEARGAESYRVIHAALVSALRAAGVEARLSGEMPPAVGGECFLQPVEYDVMDGAGRKIAGAGQRRTADGLLHQGSVAGVDDYPEILGKMLADRVLYRDFEPDPDWLDAAIFARYGNPGWHERR